MLWLLCLGAAAWAQKAETILVFSPHCDDETLSSAGFIQQELYRRNPVKIIFMTNGDGYTLSAAEELKKFPLDAQDYIEFGYDRQAESLSAAAILGLTPDDTIFLGYPDGGLEKLLSRNWSKERLYTSPHTKTRFSPYTGSYQFHAPYCGENVVNNLTAIIQRYAPDKIYMPSPYDDHPDHRATFSLVNLALEKLALRDKACHAGLYTYLVHWKNWPEDRLNLLKPAISFPAEIKAMLSDILEITLTPEQKQRKLEALKCYKSQMRTMKKYLLSFVKTNELFAASREIIIPKAPAGGIEIDGLGADWDDIPPAIIEPHWKSLLDALPGIAEVKSIYACEDASNLYLRLDISPKPSPTLFSEINLYALGPKDIQKNYFFRLGPGKKFKSNLMLFPCIWKSGEITELLIPKSNFWAARSYLLSASVKFMGIKMDKTYFSTLRSIYEP